MTINIEELVETLRSGPTITVVTRTGTTFIGRFIDTGAPNVVAVELADREVVLVSADSLDYYTFYVPEGTDDDAD